MGYPMTWKRVVNRNNLNGDYSTDNLSLPLSEKIIRMIAGDMRRLEKDNLDEWHLKAYSEACNVSVEQVRAILEMFFSGNVFTYEMAPKTIDEVYKK